MANINSQDLENLKQIFKSINIDLDDIELLEAENKLLELVKNLYRK